VQQLDKLCYGIHDPKFSSALKKSYRSFFVGKLCNILRNSFFRIQKSNSGDKSDGISVSSVANDTSDNKQVNDASIDSSDEEVDEDDEDDPIENGNLSDKEGLVDLEDLGSFVKVGEPRSFWLFC
jgi:hypothetical protein